MAINGEHSALWNELAKVDVASEKYMERDSRDREAELRTFLAKHLAGKNVSDLIAIQNQMLIEAERARDPLSGVARESFDKEMGKVFRHLNVLMRQAPPDPNAKKVERAEVRSPDMEAAMSDEAKLRAEREANRAEKRRLAQEPQEKTVIQQPPDPVEAKTRLQQIKDIVDAGVKSIQAKANAVTTNMKKKYQIRKAVKESKGQGNLLQILSANANKAIDNIRRLGDRASAKILELKEKVRADRTAERDVEIGSPTNARQVAGSGQLLNKAAKDNAARNANKAAARVPPLPPAGAALTQEEIAAHRARIQEGTRLPPAPPKEAALTQEEINAHRTRGLDTRANDNAATLQANAKLHDYPEVEEQGVEGQEVKVEKIDAPLAEADVPLPPPPTPKIAAPPEPPSENAQAEAVVEQLQEEIHGVEQKFVEVAASMEILAEKVEVSAPLTREDVQNMELNFDFDTSAFGPDTKDANAVDAEARQAIEKNQQPAEKVKESEFDEQMRALEKAFEKINSEPEEPEGIAPSATKATDPGAPSSGNNSGSTTPRSPGPGQLK